MKKLLLLPLLIIGLQIFAQDLVILHTNDIHSHLNGFSPETEYTPFQEDNDPTLGGMARIAGFIAKEKATYGNKLMVVDAGDFLMGTLYQTIETHEGFQLRLMKEIGYEYVCLGNHEFDFGANKLASIINSTKLKGSIPTILCTNYDKSIVGDDEDFIHLIEGKVILPYTTTHKNGKKIGIFSVVGNDAEESIASYYGIRFHDPVKVARRTAKYLKEVEKVDFILLLSHCGVTKNKKGEWKGEDVKLAKAVPDIDLIISAHSHTQLDKPIQIGKTIIVQTGWGGKNVGKVEVSMRKGTRNEITASLVPMDDEIVADASAQQMIDSKNRYIEKEIIGKLGINMTEPVAETSFNLCMDDQNPLESNLGPLVADASYLYLNSLEIGKTDVSIVASGVIRADMVKGTTGRQNINDVFNIMPLGAGNDNIPGSPLGRIYITGNELKKVMELILTVYPSMVNYFLYYSGMEIDYYPNKGVFRKITAIRIGNERDGYKTVSFSRSDKTLYSLAANKYILSFIGTLKKMSKGIVNVIAKNADGSPIKDNNFLIDGDPKTEGIQEVKEWIVLYHYLHSLHDTDGNGIPDIPKVYQTKRVALTPMSKN
jgi:5'-nucleotidase / UDP-sugar diphosphatase